MPDQVVTHSPHGNDNNESDRPSELAAPRSNHQSDSSGSETDVEAFMFSVDLDIIGSPAGHSETSEENRTPPLPASDEDDLDISVTRKTYSGRRSGLEGMIVYKDYWYAPTAGPIYLGASLYIPGLDFSAIGKYLTATRRVSSMRITANTLALRGWALKSSKNIPDAKKYHETYTRTLSRGTTATIKVIAHEAHRCANESTDMVTLVGDIIITGTIFSCLTLTLSKR